MKLLRMLASIVALLVVFAVGTHMVSLFLIGAAVIAWHLATAFAANPAAGALLLLVAVSAGYIIGRGTEDASLLLTRGVTGAGLSPSLGG